MPYHSFAPEAAPVLQSQYAATCLITHGTLGTDWQVAFQPLVRHSNLQEKCIHSSRNGKQFTLSSIVTGLVCLLGEQYKFSILTEFSFFFRMRVRVREKGLIKFLQSLQLPPAKSSNRSHLLKSILSIQLNITNHKGASRGFMTSIACKAKCRHKCPPNRIDFKKNNFTHKLTPSSSSIISFPMEARVVHLQLLVALTAQRLWALNLHTEKHRQTHTY